MAAAAGWLGTPALRLPFALPKDGRGIPVAIALALYTLNQGVSLCAGGRLNETQYAADSAEGNVY
jgi:hypothetical protein